MVFGYSLATKSLWVFLSRDDLWRCIKKEKYINNESILNWIRKWHKLIVCVSNQWWARALAFPVIGRFLAWKVGNGIQVRIGSYVIVGCGGQFFLREGLLTTLQEAGLCTLNKIGNTRPTTFWKQEWLSTTKLGLDAIWHPPWKLFIVEIQKERVHLSGVEDELVWHYHNSSGQYSTKMGYKDMIAEVEVNAQLCFKKIWKVKGPPKGIIFFWAILKGGVLTWDHL